MEGPKKKLGGYQFYREVLGAPKYIVAPMIENSELPFRILTRRYGAQLTYTPMLYSKVFMRSEKYRNQELIQAISDEDRPLVTQFCGISSQEILPAALIAQKYCEAIGRLTIYNSHFNITRY
eukprot:TRINITY_DN501_c0_g1_i4.p1 TRINITY_DN501_c0_g1~~TRINITY_DN501_c0_g1_i4.p1  ORF type:complete len:122 (+),score=2.16 TRINITY_DN501_c0_g1_i4:45-410(+)